MQIVHRARDRRTGKVTAIIIADRMNGPNRSSRNRYIIFFDIIKLINTKGKLISTIDTIRHTGRSTIRAGMKYPSDEGRTA